MFSVVSRTQRYLSAAAAFVIAGAISGCGDSQRASVVVHVGKSSITQASVEHWAKALTGQSFATHAGIPAPRAVLATLTSPARCAASAAPVAAHAKPVPSAAELRTMCRTLYKSAKLQATEYLLSVQTALAEARKYGVSVSAHDVQKYFTQWRQGALSSSAALRQYLTERGWTLADQLYDSKRAVLWIKITQHVHKVASSLGGGERTYVGLLQRNTRELVAETRCRVGYVVQGCKGYRSTPNGRLSLSVAVEQIVEGG